MLKVDCDLFGTRPNVEVHSELAMLARLLSQIEMTAVDVQI